MSEAIGNRPACQVRRAIALRRHAQATELVSLGTAGAADRQSHYGFAEGATRARRRYTMATGDRSGICQGMTGAGAARAATL